MKYKGSIGEFKPLAFAIWTLVFLALGLFIYCHLSFATQVPESDSKATAGEVRQFATDCQAKVLKLEGQLSALQKQNNPVHKKHKSH